MRRACVGTYSWGGFLSEQTLTSRAEGNLLTWAVTKNGVGHRTEQVRQAQRPTVTELHKTAEKEDFYMAKEGLATRVYGWLKSWVPERGLRRGLRLLPRRWVITRKEFGISFKFVLYPREGGDFGDLFRHEMETRKLLHNVVHPGDLVLDVGAHHGVYTLPLAQLVQERGEVHAFEPHPDNIRRLCENIRLNRLHNVFVKQVAVSDVTGTARFNYGNSPKVSSLRRIPGQKQDWHEVEVISIDAYWRNLGQPKVAFAKIDVEGGENLVVHGMSDTISICRPVMLLEFHQFALGERETADMFSELFGQHGYHGQVMYMMDVGRYRSVPSHTSLSSYAGLTDVAGGAHTVGLLMWPRESE